MFRWLDDATHPFAKILKVNHTFSISISINDKSLKISVVQAFSKFSNDIFCWDETIVILVKVKKSSSYMSPITWKFLLKFYFYQFQSLNDHILFTNTFSYFDIFFLIDEILLRKIPFLKPFKVNLMPISKISHTFQHFINLLFCEWMFYSWNAFQEIIFCDETFT